MSVHLNDQERVESLNLWWKKYGNYIVIAVLSAAVAIAVWRFWENRQEVKLTNASDYYQLLLNDISKNQTADAIAQANFLIQNFSGTGYANMAALFLAQNDVNQNNLNAAQQQLQSLISQTSGPLHAIACLRLARVDLALQQPEQALKVLSSIPAGFEVSYNILRGDAYAQMQQYKQANVSYQAALQAVQPNDKPLQDMIYMRISSIPATN
jgi:predicted negative regulator of RcsB-dependent stress response